jgi:hypothetical protein
MGKAILQWFYNTDRFSIISFDQYKGYTQIFLFTFYLNKDIKAWILRKIPEVKIKQDKMLKD